MANSVLKVSPDTLTEMKRKYESVLVDKAPPGSIFVAKLSSCTVTAYKSGKVLFQGGDAEKEAQQWGEIVTSSPKPKATVTAHAYAPPETIGKLSIIGSDEVGTGDYFGPVIVVAAYVESTQLDTIQKLGVKDSKGLTDANISKIAKQIMPLVPHSTLILHNEKYNDIQRTGMSQGKMKALLHNQAISNLTKKLEDTSKVDGVLIDQFVVPNTYFRHIADKKQAWDGPTYFSTKGESVHLAVAAASIIARYVFVREFEKLSEKAGLSLHKGAGAKVDADAAMLIRKKGVESLNQFAKLHFANTEKAKKLV